MCKPKYVAHISEDKTREQSVIEHLRGTAKLAEGFARRFGAEELAHTIGMLHDIGKYSKEFDRRIRQNGPKIDHATAGAREIYAKCGLAAYCISGHHGGLPNGGNRKTDVAGEPTLMGRLKKELCDYSDWTLEVEDALSVAFTPPRVMGKGCFALAFFIRMLFSCLVDADYLDTERFMSDGEIQRVSGDSTEVLLDKLNRYVRAWKGPKETSGITQDKANDGINKEVNEKRNTVQDECATVGERGDKGLYTLTVPTGGGKTISSLMFALKHAVKHGMDRIIYVVPFCTIIDQTAGIFEEILGEENVLAHHSNTQYDETTDKDYNVKKLATENWDMPVIVTTSVQFFESLYSNKTSRCRKLHNMANSIIIFDEAQALPTELLKPCIRAIAELATNYGSTCVLCTATQPAIKDVLHEISPDLNPVEICSDTKGLYEFFKRVTFVDEGVLSDAELAERLNAQNQVLCIVDTRKRAQSIYAMLEGEGLFHLSTLMRPIDRRSELDEIKKRIKPGDGNEDKRRCIVVSTSLVEAGVDLDFPTLYKACAGLDSVIQAAGRCNREGKRPARESVVHVFTPEGGSRLPAALERPRAVARGVMQCCDDYSSPEAIEKYFTELFSLTGEGLDAKRAVEAFERAQPTSLPFKTVADEFKFIENRTRSIFIPFDDADAKSLEQRLRDGDRSRELFRKLGKYSVDVYHNHYNALNALGALDELDESVTILTDNGKYSKKTGLLLTEETGIGIFG